MNKEEERKKEYEKRNGGYQRISKQGKVPGKEGDLDSEEKRKYLYEKNQKGTREQKKEEKKEELKEKGAEAVGSFFGLPPFLSRFIYHHKLLSVVIFIGIPFIGLMVLVALTVGIFA